MNNVNYGNKTYSEMDVLGEHVLLKKIKKDTLRCEDGIYIPEIGEPKNTRIGLGQILEVTEKTSKDYGISKDDYVLYDYYSAHGDWEENIITNAENLIMVLSKDEANAYLMGASEV